MDVIKLLKKDHKMIQKIFKEFEGLSGSRGAQKKPTLVDQIRQALMVHTQVVKELVYPAFQENRSLKEQISEAKEEHQVTKHLLSELEQMGPEDEQYDAKVKVLCEYLMHHIKEEEKEIFPQAQKRLSSKRLQKMGEEAEARRGELMGEIEDIEKDDDVDTDAMAMNEEASENKGSLGKMDKQESRPDHSQQHMA